ncbi:glycosyltransferase [Halomonas sp. LY9]
MFRYLNNCFAKFCSLLPKKTDVLDGQQIVFDEQWYLDAYPDVAVANVDPWQHYLLHGRFEGRLPQRNRSLEWEYSLWRGAHNVVLPRLLGLFQDSSATSQEIRTSRAVIANWYRYKEDWQGIIDLFFLNNEVDSVFSKESLYSKQELFNVFLLLNESICRLPSKYRHKLMLAHVVDMMHGLFPHKSEALLASSNSSVFLDSERFDGLVDINRLFTAFELCEIDRIDTKKPASIDNLKMKAELSFSVGKESLPLISVVLPLFNAADTIGTALRSLFEQKGVRLEIIVVDDASHDASALRVKEWDSRRPSHVQMKIVHHEINQGAYAARNSGVALAQGDYITVHDCDDWSHPDKLRLQAEVLQHDLSLKASLSDWVRATPSLLFHRWRLDEYGWVYPNISSLMVRREVIETLGYWDDVKVNADTEYRERLVAAYGESAVQHVLPGIPLAFGRASAESLSQRSESHLISQFTGVRYHYMAAARRWHQSASTPAALYMPRYPHQRLFYAPSAMLRDGKQNASPLALEDQLRACGLFDAGWYLTRYIDLQQAMVDPFGHFCKAGSAEGRDPGPGFSTSGYRRRYADELAQTGMAPWEHYLLHSAALTGQQAIQEALPEWKGQPVLAGRPTVMVCAHQLGSQLFGAERSLLDVLDAMQALSWNTIVVLPEAGNADYEAELLARCCVLAVVPYGWWQVGKAPVESCVAHLQAMIERYSVQAVHANTLVLDEPLVAAKRAGVPAVVHVRELPAHDPALCSTLGASAEELRLRVHHCSDIVIANSQAVAQAFDGEALKDASPIYVVPNTIHMAPLLALSAPSRLLCSTWVC